ncbi:SbcC/MukB-like Walker B domain-containing protein [Bacillus sp. N9]
MRLSLLLNATYLLPFRWHPRCGKWAINENDERALSPLRKTDRSKGNVQSGLELLIFDQYTGQERHVKTLSGGESFKASLSLALGLADVVQQHAGGVSLETMFIDEGFGTLDPESLDHAIEALMDIQSSGRLVGIISHVPELKERIDAQLEVTASQTGSKTQFLFTS